MLDAAKAERGKMLDAEAAEKLGLVTFALDDIDWDDEVRVFLEERASFSPDGLTGLEANLRFGGPETMESKIFARLTAWQNWIFQRPNAVGEEGALRRYGTGQKPVFDTRRVLSFPPAVSVSEAWRADSAQDRSEPNPMSEIINVDYSTKIPNNVDLTEDRQVLRALESWHPGYIDWWKDMGPEGFQEALVYLRTAVSVDPKGWAKFDYVKMPDYRWGILLAPQEEDRKIPFGHHYRRAGLAGGAGRIPRHAAPPDRDPGRHRAGLGRAAAPSRQDRAVALRHAQRVPGQRRGGPPPLGDGLSAAEIFRPRRPRGGRASCCSAAPASADKPRMLGAFNEATPDWLSFHMFTFFTDRDGKMQLESLAQSGFDPLSRTCRFMLTEEAHHMFVGETGIGRTLQRTCEAMKAAGIEDPNDIEKVRALGVIDLPTMQKKLNLHYSLSLDLFGSEVSTNAANAFNCRPQGPLPGDQDRGRPPARELDLSGAQARRRRDQAGRRAGAHRDQHAAARRLHRRLPARPRSLEQDHRAHRRAVQARAAARRLPSPDRRVQGTSRRRRPASSSTRRPGAGEKDSGCRRRTTAISSRA